jgi:hypothetical protein
MKLNLCVCVKVVSDIDYNKSIPACMFQSQLI